MKSKLLISLFAMILLAGAVNAYIISGTVTDTNANPLTAQVNVYNAITGAPINNTNTNPSTGDYSVDVGTTQMLMSVEASATNYDNQTTPIFVDGNKTINFALGPIQSVVLSGYVRDNASSPLNNADVVVKQGGATFTQTNTNSTGFYSVNVVDGASYSVTASLTGYDSVTTPVTISGATSQDFTLTQTQTCVDNDGDGRGDGCTLGPDCNDNDANQYPGASCSRTCYSGSTYDASCICTGGSYTCSSGGGSSSGSSYSGTDYEMDIDAGDTIIKELRSKDSVVFEYEGEEHTVNVNYVYASSVSVTVSSSPVTESIALYQTKGFNFDNDLMNDFFITVKSISSGAAELEFRLSEILDLDIPYTPTAPQVPDEDVNVPQGPVSSGNKIRIIVENEDVPPEEDEEKSSFSFVGFLKNILSKILYLKYVLAGIVILAVLILAISLVTKLKAVQKTAKRSRKKEEMLLRLKELESQIRDLKKAI